MHISKYVHNASIINEVAYNTLKLLMLYYCSTVSGANFVMSATGLIIGGYTQPGVARNLIHRIASCLSVLIARQEKQTNQIGEPVRACALVTEAAYHEV